MIDLEFFFKLLKKEMIFPFFYFKFNTVVLKILACFISFFLTLLDSLILKTFELLLSLYKSSNYTESDLELTLP